MKIIIFHYIELNPFYKFCSKDFQASQFSPLSLNLCNRDF